MRTFLSEHLQEKIYEMVSDDSNECRALHLNFRNCNLANMQLVAAMGSVAWAIRRVDPELTKEFPVTLDVRENKLLTDECKAAL